MDLNTLKYIVEVVETGSISRAASNLFMSQPTLSSQIANFEKEMGRAIFTRTNRGVQLTSYGAEVYHHAKAVVQQCDIISQKLSDDVNEHKVKISSFSSDIISVEFFKVCGLYTQVNYEFELYECGTERALERLKNRDSDMAIIMFSQFQEKKLHSHMQSEDLVLEPLFTGDMRIRVGAQTALAQKEVLSADDLKDLFHVQKADWLEGMFSLAYELDYMGIPQGTKTIICNGNKTYHDALRQLPSFSAGPSWSCKWSVGPDLKRIPFDGNQVRMTCGVAKRRNEILKEEYQNFISHLVEAYGG